MPIKSHKRFAIEGLLLIEPQVFGDSRGFFFENYVDKAYEEIGLSTKFVQDNISKSSQGVLRGLHFQKEYPQAKLVSVIQGEVFDVAVDLRKDSPSYLQYEAVILSDKNHLQFYIPEGFAHGFYVLSDEAIFTYKVSDYYHPNDEGGIIYNDRDLKIAWPLLNDSPSLSEKDAQWPSLQEYLVQEG
ncbi:MAG: dTDP-4-dehydrorhamnose 3,5-epimerase [Coriobacteriia bacterium]|nr:dTDP-4-dehydrorhamnose 3,5-epimerase [Coriobacteriia bacterium]